MKPVLSALSIFLATAVGASAAGFRLEAGVAYAKLNAGKYSTADFTANGGEAANTVSPDYVGAVSSREDSAAAPYLSLGYEFSDHFVLKLGYQQIGRTTATARADVVIAGEAETASVVTQYSDEVEVVTLSPEFRWQVTPVVAIVLAPELNWVTSDAEVRITTNAPAIDLVPYMSRTEREVTWGAALGAEWALSSRWQFVARYRYVDLKPSWGRQGHLFSGGLQWRF